MYPLSMSCTVRDLAEKARTIKPLVTANTHRSWVKAIRPIADMKVEDVDPDAFVPEMEIITPFLWHGSLTDTKETHSLLIQATGEGVILIDATDLDGRIIGSLRIEVNATSDDNAFEDVPLSKQYERKWSHRYKAAQYRIRSEGGGGLLRIIGFAVTVRT